VAIMMYSYTDTIPVVSGSLTVDLEVPDTARDLVVFAHGAGSSRLSPRNTRVAGFLRSTGEFGTLLFDLLTPGEDLVYENRFDIDLLTDRLVEATRWVRAQGCCWNLPVAYFGASTGAAAALRAAAELPDVVHAVVSRGGRPDLAGESLTKVHAPTLLIVGGRDEVVLDLNRRAQAAIPGKCELVVVPGATHLFEEPGTLEKVAVLARDWFIDHLSPARGRQSAAKPRRTTDQVM
jgi:putative phosphoribosyl transferase